MVSLLDLGAMEKRSCLVIIILCNIKCCSTQVSIFPSGPFHDSPLGCNVTFNCLSTVPYSQLMWLLNGSQLGSNTYDSNDIMGIFSENRIALHFFNVDENDNNTRIQCEAMFNTTATILSNVVVLRTSSDYLSDIQSLNVSVENETIFLTWMPPQNAQSNVTYCVEIVDSTSTSSSAQHTQCNISDTEFNNTLPSRSWCDCYFISVTPVNAFGKGKTHTMKYLLVQSPPVVKNVTQNTTQLWTLIMSERVCNGEITVVDFNTGETSRIGGADLSISENNITFSTEQLTFNRHYSVNVTASNIAGSKTSHTSITTHGVTGAVVMERNGIEVTALYSEHSSASGALFSFVFITESGDVDFTRSDFLPLDRNTPPNHTLPFNLHSGHYKMYVYDIEQDGTLYNGVGYPAVTEEFFASGTENGLGQSCTSSTENCHVNTSHGIIGATCTSNFMASGLQVIALQSSASRVHLIYTIKSVDLQTPVTVQVERSGVYQVTMFAIREDSTLACSEQAIVDVQIETTELQPTTPLTGIPEPEDDSAVIGAVVVVILVVTVAVVVVTVLVIFKLIAVRKKSDAQSHLWRPIRVEDSGGIFTATYHNFSGAEEVFTANNPTDNPAVELPANHPPDPGDSNEMTQDDYPISEKQAKPSVQGSANADNSEEEHFVVAGVERGPHGRIVGLKANAKNKLSVDHSDGGISDQESDSNHRMPLPAGTRDHDGQTHEAKNGSALPAFHKEVSHVMGGDPGQDGTPLVGQENAPNTQTQALEVNPASDHTPNTQTPASEHTPNTPTLQSQALEVSPASDHTSNTQTPASDHTPNTPTLQTHALEVSPASDHTSNTPTPQTRALEVSPASDHTPNTP